MTSKNLTRAIALSSFLVFTAWAVAGGCGGHPLGTPHPSGGAGTGSAGSSTTGTAGASTTGTGTGAGGNSTTGVGGTSAAGTSGSGGSACMAAKNEYDVVRYKLAQSYGALPCKANADCLNVYEPGNCGPECPDVALLASVQDMFVADLKSNADLCNGVCPPRPLHSCPANPAICENGRCALAGIIGVGGSTGTSGGAGATGSAGASGGAGQGGTAGATACGPCAQPQCKPGFMSVVDPTISCCPICRPINCATVDCANPNCPGGFHAEVPMGQCCPICVAGVSALCNKAQLVYQSDRKAMLEKYGMSGCMIDGDCRLVFESNACVSSCGVALPVSTAGFFETNIQGDANACDSACPPLLSPPCVPLTAVCSNGMCTAVSAPLR